MIDRERVPTAKIISFTEVLVERELVQLQTVLTDVRQVMQQSMALLGQVEQRLAYLQGVPIPRFTEALSPRELEILRLVAMELTNREIAQRLVVVEGTIKTHMTHILAKLDATSRREAVYKGRLLGLI